MNIMQLIFGCKHRKLSVPFTIPTGKIKSKRTYKVCLDCTAHIPYNLKTFTASAKQATRRQRKAKPCDVAYGKFVADREANRELEIARQ